MQHNEEGELSMRGFDAVNENDIEPGIKGIEVLVVELEAVIALDMEQRLRGLGCSVVLPAFSGEEAVEKARELRPDLILTSVRLNGRMDGIEAASLIRERFDIPAVFFVDYFGDRIRKRAEAARPLGFLHKPVDEEEFKSVICRAFFQILKTKEK